MMKKADEIRNRTSESETSDSDNDIGGKEQRNSDVRTEKEKTNN